MLADNIITFYNNLSNVKVLKIDSDKIYLKPIRGGRTVTVSLKLTPGMAYFVGLVLGDGHLTKVKYKIIFEVANRNLANRFSDVVAKIFSTKIKYSLVHDNRPNKKLRYRFELNSKPIHKLLTDVFQVPSGKKSDIIFVPRIIKDSEPEFKTAFLRGVFETEGGKRSHGFGISTASRTFRDDVVSILKEFGVSCYTEQWYNKAYEKHYFGLIFKQDSVNKFLV